MAAKNFRDILAQFLEEESPTPPVAAPGSTFIPTEMLFDWSPPPGPVTHAKRAYPRSSPREPLTIVRPPATPPAAASAPPTPPEPHVRVSDLDLIARTQVEMLVKLGAPEMREKLRMSTLKKAHRRLARRLHPDTAGAGRQEDFLLLQSIYEGLCRTLTDRFSESAGDSESASASGSRPRAAS